MNSWNSMVFNQRGMIYFTALAVMVILTGLGLAYLYVARTETMASANELRSLKSFYLAEAGVEHAMASLLYGGVSYPGSGEYTIVDSVNLPPVYDGDAEVSYRAYMPDAKTIVGQSSTGGATSQEVQVEINDSGFPYAVMEGEEFVSGCTQALVGTFDGNLLAPDANFDYFFNAGLKILGRIDRMTKKYDDLIPSPNFSYYETLARNVSPITKDDTYYDTSQDLDDVTDTGNSNTIYYINGDLYIKGPGPVDRKGTFVVTNNLVIGRDSSGNFLPLQNSSLTITPAEHKPAVIVGNRLTTPKDGILYTGDDSVTGSDLKFNGMVYTDSFVHLANFHSLTINGVLVSRNKESQSSAIQNGVAGQTSNFSVTYDPYIDPGLGSFSGTTVGKPVIVSWQGHGNN